MAVYSQNLRFVVGRLEGTAGTMETLTSADFDARLYNPAVTITVEQSDEASRYARSDHAEDDSVPGTQMGQITFESRCHWGGNVTTAPHWWKFAEGCGLRELDYSSAGIALVPSKSFDEKTMTLWVYDCQRGTTNAAIYKFSGCMGTATLGTDGVGKPWMWSFTFSGKLVSYTLSTTPVLAMYDMEGQCPEKLLSNTVLIDGTTQKISAFSLDLGNEVQPIFDQSQATGIAHYGITSRKPRMSMNPLVESTFNVYPYLTDGTNCVTLPKVDMTGNHMSISIPKAQVLTAGVGNREGLVSWDLNLKLLNNGVDGTQVRTDMSAEHPWRLLIGATA